MYQRINEAIPTEQTAIDHLKKEGLTDFRLSAFKAKTLYNQENQVITSHLNFECPTENCTAPITCKSIKRKVNTGGRKQGTPTFVNQSRSVNLHKEGCPHNPELIERNLKDNEEIISKFTYENSGNVIADFDFMDEKTKNESTKSSKTIKNSSDENSNSNSNRRSTPSNDNTKVKARSTRMKKLKEFVEIYESDPNYILNFANSNNSIPIKFLFKRLYQNDFFDPEVKKSKKYFYFSEGKLLKTSKDNILSFHFKDWVKVDGQTYNPSISISEEAMKKAYPDIYSSFINGEKDTFKAYITYPLIVVNVERNNELKTYINFGHRSTGRQVKAFDESLIRNFYIR